MFFQVNYIDACAEVHFILKFAEKPKKFFHINFHLSILYFLIKWKARIGNKCGKTKDSIDIVPLCLYLFM